MDGEEKYLNTTTKKNREYINKYIRFLIIKEKKEEKE
jgi:hypothetical protein